jgi:hypothetical protein
MQDENGDGITPEGLAEMKAALKRARVRLEGATSQERDSARQLRGIKDGRLLATLAFLVERMAV